MTLSTRATVPCPLCSTRRRIASLTKPCRHCGLSYATAEAMHALAQRTARLDQHWFVHPAWTATKPTA